MQLGNVDLIWCVALILLFQKMCSILPACNNLNICSQFKANAEQLHTNDVALLKLKINSTNCKIDQQAKISDTSGASNLMQFHN